MVTQRNFIYVVSKIEVIHDANNCVVRLFGLYDGPVLPYTCAHNTYTEDILDEFICSEIHNMYACVIHFDESVKE